MGVTIKDVAKASNVSIATVSRVINNKDEGVSNDTRERIKQIMKEMDYRPSGIARGLVTKKTHTLGLIVPDISNPFFPAIVKGIEDSARNSGYNIILCNSDDSPHKEVTSIRVLKEKCVDGIIYIGTNSASSEGIILLQEDNTPFVYIDRSNDITECSSVSTDGRIGMYKMTEYLIQNGHKSIAYIKGSVNDERVEGCVKALEEHELKLNSQLIYIGDFRLKSGEDGARVLLKKGIKFTAIICENDLMAAGVMEYLTRNNIRVPEDISVTGYDDIYISQLLHPKLTTIHQQTYEMGKKSVEVLLKSIITKETVYERIVLEPTLIIRNSVKNII
ncbi:MAG: LacI family DNA-binding transcriptional regulator [Clostridium sp.]